MAVVQDSTAMMPARLQFQRRKHKTFSSAADTHGQLPPGSQVHIIIQIDFTAHAALEALCDGKAVPSGYGRRRTRPPLLHVHRSGHTNAVAGQILRSICSAQTSRHSIRYERSSTRRKIAFLLGALRGLPRGGPARCCKRCRLQCRQLCPTNFRHGPRGWNHST